MILFHVKIMKIILIFDTFNENLCKKVRKGCVSLELLLRNVLILKFITKNRENNMLQLKNRNSLKSNLLEDIKMKKRKLFTDKLLDEDPNTPKKAKKQINKDQPLISQSEKIISKEAKTEKKKNVEKSPQDLECDEESLNFYSVFLENGRHKTKLESKFWRKLDLFLRENDFRCPALNR